MKDLYDVVIIGGGPAGLTAAIYLTRAKYRVLLLEKEKFGGQITISYEVVNYPGVSVCSGKELTDVMYRQAEYFGTEFLLAEATKLELKNDVKIVHTNKGNFQCFGVLLASGAHPRMIGFKGENEFKGRGVAYCATCDGEFFTGKEVFVIGGGFAAAEESVFLTKYASHVTILIREEDFTCAKAVADQARGHEKISVITDTTVEEVSGDGVVNYIRYKNHKTGEITEYKADKNDGIGVFVFAGYEPETALVKDMAKLDDFGYIITDNEQKTSVEGLYAAGDICIKPLRQVVTATGDGALAATELEKFVSKARKKTNMYPKPPEINKEALKAKNDNQDIFDIEHIGVNANTSSEVNHPQHNAESEINSGLKKIATSKGNNRNEINTNIFTYEMESQLKNVFSRMENPLILKLYLDERPVSEELRNYTMALANMTEKVSVEIEDVLTDLSSERDFASEFDDDWKNQKDGDTMSRIKTDNLKDAASTCDIKKNELPCVRIFDKNHKYTGLAFHGVPGGHEFSSFVLGLYNAAGPGQNIDEKILKRIEKIDCINGLNIKILVSLSCTMCPELVVAAQRMATIGKNITAEVYDIRHFEELKNKYNVMSVPCMIINDEEIFFGKKSLEELVDLLEGLL